MAIVRDLRARCSWDRAQTRETLRPYLVEEVLELEHALADGDVAAIRSELSDFLLHLAFQLVIAEEQREFTADEVADELVAKMHRRHPHLFGVGPAESWERIKRRERQGNVLGGVIPTLPALLMACRLQERAASVGFDWPDTEGPLLKVREELSEVESQLRASGNGGEPMDPDPNAPGPQPSAELTEEIGDLLFAAVNLARKAGVQPGPALDRANRKFRRRFEAIERLAAERGIDVGTAGLEVLDALWEEVKSERSEKTARSEK
jgi:MazG family protein